MPTVSRTFTVTAAPDRVVDYLKDFGHAEEWDPGTESCSRNDSGEIGVGSSWHNTSKLMGVETELTYTLKQLTKDTVVLEGSNDRAVATDTITVKPAPEGSEVTYHAELEMKGAAKLANPVMKLEFEHLAGKVEKNLTEVLGRLGV